MPVAFGCNYTFILSSESLWLHVPAISDLAFLIANRPSVTVLLHKLCWTLLGVSTEFIISNSHNIPKEGLITPLHKWEK